MKLNLKVLLGEVSDKDQGGFEKKNRKRKNYATWCLGRTFKKESAVGFTKSSHLKHIIQQTSSIDPIED